MSRRFFSDTPIQGAEALLAGTEAHHLLHVMRLSAGDRVVLFDGGGAEYEAEVKATSRREVELAVLARHETIRENVGELNLGVALPKGDRQKVLVEKLTELGVARLIPITTQRSVAEASPKTLERLRRGVIEASKQCGRNRLMQISPAMELTDWLKAPGDDHAKWIACPGAASLLAHGGSSTTTWVAIGPEGGFSDEEVATAAALGWAPLGLGTRVLRTETAAIAAAVLAGSLGR